MLSITVGFVVAVALQKTQNKLLKKQEGMV
jgi:hypothetical protein